jgi:DNA-binding winged helix-turn-helix (wHTH) protein
VRLQIGELIFDAETRQLTRSGSPVELSPLAFQLLELLLRERPRALSHEELRDQLWPETFVSYTALPRLVTEVRRALNDDSRSPTFVRSLRRFGYAFSGPVAELDTASDRDTAGCELLWGQRIIGLLPGDNLVGRSPECRVRIVSPKISRQHARLRVGSEGVVLEDLGSSNGTWWRGERVSGPVQLRDGDEIGVGEEILVFRTGELLPTEREEG